MTDGNAPSKAREIKATTLALPKGGGAIRGLGEVFQANAFTGGATLSVPITTTACRDSTPALALTYLSGGGNGIFGLGFELGLPAITRKTSKGQPRYTAADTVLSADGQDMVVDTGWEARMRNGYRVTRYLPRHQEAFEAIEFWENPATRDSFWRVLDAGNTVRCFGRTPLSRIVNPDAPEQVFSWLMDAIITPHGDAVLYEYRAEDTANVAPAIHEPGHTQTANRYPARIRYGNSKPVAGLADLPGAEWHFEIVFDYGEYAVDPIGERPYQPPAGAQWPARPDPFSTFNAGFEIRTHRLCRNILMFHRFSEFGADPVLVHITRFHYDQSPALSLLTSVEAIGCRRAAAGYATDGIPPLEFRYTPFAPLDGRFEPMVDGPDHMLTGADEAPRFRLVDLYGEGIPGILYQAGNTVLFSEPLGPDPDDGEGSLPAAGGRVRYAGPAAPPAFPSLGLAAAGNAVLADVTGGGRLALVAATPTGTRVAQMEPGRRWSPFRDLTAVPTDLFRPGGEMVDVTGNGLADLLRIGTDTVTVYPSAGLAGYEAAVRVPRSSDLPMFSQQSATVAVRMADVFGTGRQHLVRISNGSVEVWPNLGYGRFGDRITLGNAPAFGTDFDTANLFLADIDGSGTADIVYVWPDRLDVHINQSGNSFAGPISIPLPGGRDRLDTLSFADVLGNGCAGLVFADLTAEPRHTLYDFGCRTKPYLLCAINNNMGAETRFSYRSSTSYYLRDKRNGTPWLTALPFPVQVIDRLETIDAVSGTRLVSSFDYHHGFFDPVDREFRGFGRVDRRDTQDLDVYLAETRGAEAAGYAPPVLTRMWFHTGAWGQDNPPCDDFAREYFRGTPPVRPFVPPMFAFMEPAPDAETIRQAHASLKGLPLRQETYGLDGSAAVSVPYLVTDTVYRVRQDQRRGDQPYAVFYTATAETLTCHYERDAADPRIAHHAVLAVDATGNILTACDVAYPRRPGGTDRVPEQAVLTMLCNTARFAALTGDDLHCLGVPIESLGWQIKAPTLPASGTVFTFGEMKAQVERALATPATALTLLGHERSYYWDPGTRQPLPLGEITAEVLWCRSDAAFAEQAAVTAVFDGALAPAELQGWLAGAGKYTLDDGIWWVPGLLQTFQGAEHFFLPAATIDPFGGRSEVAYDAHDLLVVRTSDPVGNVVSATGVDYHVIQPWQLTDPNGNLAEGLYDALGRIWTTSFHGTQQGTPTGFAPLAPDRQSPAFDMAAALDAPQSYLQGAADYTHYDLFSWCGRVSGASFAPLGADAAPVRRALEEAGHISRCGAILQRFRDLGTAAALVLPGDLADRGNEVFAVVAAAVAATPIHAIVLSAETYDPAGRVAYEAAYSDGFGRIAQNKAKVDSGPAFRIDPNDGTVTEVQSTDRWLVTGRTVYNNKGNPIKKYEPYFIDGWPYAPNAALDRFGVSPLIHYDPLDRQSRVDTPKGFFSKVDVTAWSEKSYDLDDTVLDSDFYKTHIDDPGLDPRERDALIKAAAFYDTPAERRFDPMGHAVRVLRRLDAAGATLTTTSAFNVTGSVLWSADDRMAAQGMRNFEVVYALNGAKLKSTSVDAGVKWALDNAAGNPMYGRDGRETVTRTVYDRLQRPIEQWVEGGAAGNPATLRQRTVYGEAVPNAADLNLKGQVYQVYDPAGLATHEAYTIRGQTLGLRRQMTADAAAAPDWTVPGTVALDTVHDYTARWTFDGLDRILTQAVARAGETAATTVAYTYDRAGKIARTALTPAGSLIPEIYVDAATYDAKGQRQSVSYTNGVVTRYTYEPETFRLAAVVTRRGDADVLQSLRYYYDPVGNISAIVDEAQPTVFHANRQVVPVSGYTYDALYRLITASGREHPGLSADGQRAGGYAAGSIIPLPSADDGSALSTYTRSYTYDTSDNLVRIRHQGTNPCTWDITVSPTSNRGVESALTADPARVDGFFDANGNQTRMVGLPALAWSVTDTLAGATVVARPGGSPDAEYYTCDGNGERLRKVARRYANGGAVETVDETVYVWGVEIRRSLTSGTVNEEIRTVRIMDGDRCVAERLHWTAGSPPAGVPSPQVRFKLDNYMGSAVLELDPAGQRISYEEYYPYGGTAFIAGRNAVEVQLKRYRFCGKERDSVTGLYYFGARYYQPWIGRWLSADPAGPGDSINLYGYVGGNPITYTDPDGKERILVVGEGLDFSYSVELAQKRSADTIIVTQYDVTQFSGTRPANLHIYPDKLNVTQRESWNALRQWTTRQHGIDRFDVAIFNNPHAGFGLSKLQVMGVDRGYFLKKVAGPQGPFSDPPEYSDVKSIQADRSGKKERRVMDMESGSVFHRDDIFREERTGFEAKVKITGMNEDILGSFFHYGRGIIKGDGGSLYTYLPEGSRNETFIRDFSSGRRIPKHKNTFEGSRFSHRGKYRDNRGYHSYAVKYKTNLTSDKPDSSWGPTFRARSPNLDNMETWRYRRDRSPSPELDSQRRKRLRSRSRSRSR